MTTHLIHSIRLTGLAALVAAGVAGTAEAGVSFSIGTAHGTGSGHQSIRFSVGDGRSQISFGSHHCGPSRPAPCRYTERRVYVPGHWECRQERRRVGHCGSYHYATVTVRHWVPGHCRVERVHDPHCHCRSHGGGHSAYHGHR